MEKIIKKILADHYKKVTRFHINKLEEEVIKSFGGETNYKNQGGYYKFHKTIIDMQNKDMIKPLKLKDTNERNPSLRLKWEKIKTIEKDNWRKNQFFSVSDELDLSFYEKHKAFQTEEQWEKINNIYNFVKEKDKREWASIEERSLELFNNEKYITDNENKGQAKILSRLNLTYEDIKAKKYGEFFAHYDFNHIKNNVVYIVENHSTFFAFKRLIEEQDPFFNPLPEILIYGAGKKIVSSLNFLSELMDVQKTDIYYFEVDYAYNTYMVVVLELDNYEEGILDMTYKERELLHLRVDQLLGLEEKMRWMSMNPFMMPVIIYSMNLGTLALVSLMALAHKFNYKSGQIIQYDEVKGIESDYEIDLGHLQDNKISEEVKTYIHGNYHNPKKVEDIAISIGYKNDAYFRSLFKRYVGMSPNDYKKAIRRQNG